jgi:hypothetical protein
VGAGAPWYELTHDRLIKPIKDSNKVWRYKREQERAKAEEERARALAETSEKIRHKYSKLKIASIFIAYYCGTTTTTVYVPIDSSARNIAIDSSRNVYVVEAGHVLKFDGNGKFITSWGSLGNATGQFNSSEGTAIGQSIVPNGIAVDSSGHVYIADDRDRVLKFDSNGKFITSWHPTGKVNLFNTNGIAVDSSGHVYVTDSGNHRVLKFDSKGNFTSWGSLSNATGQFKWPFGIAVDSSGHVYVADDRNTRVLKFDSNGNFIKSWGSFGNATGQFNLHR